MATVQDKLTWEKIHSFAVANESMSVAERRALCVDFLRFCKTFAWTPDRDFSFARNKKGKITDLEKGVVYGGLPYGGISSGNVYRVMDYYDPETGVMDLTEAAQDTHLWANQCSLGAFCGWGRVITSAKYNWTMNMVQRNGFIPVGPYRYDPELEDFESGVTTRMIADENGEEILYQSYAKLQPADGLVTFKTAGHVVMCSKAPHVVYNDDGTINGEESYFTVLDQAQRFEERLQSGGEPFTVNGRVDARIPFAKAFKTSYLPFTFAEFIGTAQIPPVHLSAATQNGESLCQEKVSVDTLLDVTVEANWAISDVYIHVFDSEREIAKKPLRNEFSFRRKLTIGEKVEKEFFLPFIGKKLRLFAQLYNGERPLIWEGTLTE